MSGPIVERTERGTVYTCPGCGHYLAIEAKPDEIPEVVWRAYEAHVCPTPHKDAPPSSVPC